MASPKEEDMKNIRRELFIFTIVALTLLCSLSPASAAEVSRSYVSGYFFLTLNGNKCGFIKTVGGGSISAEVIDEPAGPNYFVKKHIAQPKYEDFTIQVGFSNSRPLYEWIKQAWNGTNTRVNGSITSADVNLNYQSERQFTNALLTETTIPAMDGSSKEPAYITLRFAPEITRTVKASGKLTADYSYTQADQKMFLPSNFRLQIDGLDCSKVNKIESFTVKQGAASKDVGSARDRLKDPGKLNFPNLKITMPEVAAKPFIDWYENFVIKGINDDSKEKKGSLTFLSANRTKELAIIEFSNMGIFRIQQDVTGTDQIKRVTVELYVERMTFQIK